MFGIEKHIGSVQDWIKIHIGMSLPQDHRCSDVCSVVCCSTHGGLEDDHMQTSVVKHSGLQMVK